MEAVFGDVLPVEIRGGHYWTMGLTWRAIDLIGLEGLVVLFPPLRFQKFFGIFFAHPDTILPRVFTLFRLIFRLR
mgnify:CR=1 FL=1